MAEREATVAQLGAGAVRVVWSGLLSGDTGIPVNTACFGLNRSVQIFGTFGGATVAVQIRNHENGNWQGATDPQANLISKTAEGGEEIQESSAMIRPAVTGGDATTDLTCVLEARR